MMRAMKARATRIVLGAAMLCGCGARTDPTSLESAPNGPSGSTCGTPLAVIDDRAIDSIFDTNDHPSIAFDASGAPVVLLEQWDGGFRGALGRRDDAGDWKVTPLPARTASGAIALGAPGPIAIVAYDGAGSSSLLLENGDRFDVSPMPTHDPVRSTTLWRDHAGALHYVTDKNGTPTSTYFVYDGTYHAFPLDPAADAPRLALGGDDTPWIAWTTSAATSSLWVAHGEALATELVTHEATAISDIAIGADGAPIVAAQDTESSVSLFARRGGAWARTKIDTGGFTPKAIAIVTTCDGLSLIAARNALGKGEITLVHPTGAVDVLVSHGDVEIRSVRAIVDGAHRIHVVYDQAAGGVGSTARYALIGPASP